MVKLRSTTSFVLSRFLILSVSLGCLIIFIYGHSWYEYVTSTRESLNIYTFYSVIDHSLFREFEEKTGILVNVKYFDSNSELAAQLELAGGVGYDLVMPSDRVVKRLSEKKLLSPIDYSRVQTMTELDPRLMHQPYDSFQQYSVPYAWTVYGIGYNKQWFDETVSTPESWGALFDPDAAWETEAWRLRRHTYVVGLLDDPVDLVSIASLYLYASLENVSPERLDGVRRLLKRQRAWVGGYVEANLAYYLSGVYPVVMATAALMKRLKKMSDVFGFMLPREGTLMSIETLAIPRGAKNLNAAYKFIEFVTSKEAGRVIFDTFGYFPANVQSYPLLDQTLLSDPSFYPTREMFEKLQRVNPDLSTRAVEEIWVDVRTSWIQYFKSGAN